MMKKREEIETEEVFLDSLVQKEENDLFEKKFDGLWKHYDNRVNRGSFYGVTSVSNVTFNINTQNITLH